MAGKRGKSGRRPSGAVGLPLTIRMRPDMRAELEAAAQKRAPIKAKQGINWNVSQELLLRLRRSLDKEREDRRNRAVVAICDLISDMAKRELHTDLPEQQSWHRDPFTFRAFKVAVAHLLDLLPEPAGEMRPPPTLPDAVYFGDPKTLGEFAAFREHTALLHANPLTKERLAEFLGVGVRVSRAGGPLTDMSPLTIDEFEQDFHAWSGIRRALGIEEPKE